MKLLFILAMAICGLAISTQAQHCPGGEYVPKGNNRGATGEKLICPDSTYLACSTSASGCAGTSCTAMCCRYTAGISTPATCINPVTVTVVARKGDGSYGLNTARGVAIPVQQLSSIYVKGTADGYCKYASMPSTGSCKTPLGTTGTPSPLTSADFCYSPQTTTIVPPRSPSPPPPSPPPPSPSPPPPSPPPPSPPPPIFCPACPDDFLKTTIPVPDADGCDFVCVSPAKLNCLAPLSNPITCGGRTGKTCPALSCGFAAAYAVSGPKGCAEASSKVDATAISSSTYSLAAYFSESFKKWCRCLSDGSYYGPNGGNNMMVAQAVAAANAYAEAVAVTFANYNAYVCSCCSGNSAAYATVGVDVQAAAQASADAYASAIAVVSDCFGDVLAGAASSSTTFASDVQVAIDSVYEQIVTGTYAGTCDSVTVMNRMKVAVAKVAVCVFAEAYVNAARGDSISKGITIAAPSYKCEDLQALINSSN